MYDAGFKTTPAVDVPPGCDGAFFPGDLVEQVEGDVVLHQNVAAVGGQLGVLHLQEFVAEIALLFGQGLDHGLGKELIDFGRRQGGPAGFAIAPLLHQDYAGAEFQNRGGLQLFVAVRKREEFDVEFAGDLTQQVVDADRAAVRQGKRKIGREHRHAAASGGARGSLPARDSRAASRIVRAWARATTRAGGRCGQAARRARRGTKPNRSAGGDDRVASYRPGSCGGARR